MIQPTLVRKQQPTALLTPSDQKLLAELEAKVENSMMGFCVALAEIRDHKDGMFWKERYTSFQEYTRLLRLRRLRSWPYCSPIYRSMAAVVSTRTI